MCPNNRMRGSSLCRYHLCPLCVSVREMCGCEPPISESHERASLSEQADGTAVPTEMSCLINEMYLLASDEAPQASTADSSRPIQRQKPEPEAKARGRSQRQKPEAGARGRSQRQEPEAGARGRSQKQEPEAETRGKPEAGARGRS
jgi:hypothetical protein